MKRNSGIAIIVTVALGILAVYVSGWTPCPADVNEMAIISEDNVVAGAITKYRAVIENQGPVMYDRVNVTVYIADESGEVKEIKQYEFENIKPGDSRIIYLDLQGTHAYINSIWK
ncbi:hypothetical protein F8E02_02170 [Methanoculleus sp. Wushi-C6]|uniref:CARDB domain-containing protein n=1 Tax=Methanoculleus caldifontis TaxID=2651577 RepID=A0ABU3WYE1_9EURY|nr:hypothetical protein [Methanoculleus sp. Wushi-C6]MDV2480829.1 hypothetical protein [Methanoculleus sp. Wushi-C6]